MNPKWRSPLIVLFLFLVLCLVSCAGKIKRPCSQGGEPSHLQNGMPIPYGKKSCTQIKNEFGAYVNDGKYYEWYPNEKIAIVGEYKKGKKIGRWQEWDPNGQKVSDSVY